MQDNQLGDYLRARREIARPEEHGLPALRHRRVAGLRREEVAILAGISAEYYIRLERGRDRHPSVQVLDALASVFGLDEESRSYLATIAGLASPIKATVEVVPQAVRALVDSTIGPAFVLGRFMDVLASNAVTDRLHQGLCTNAVRHVFLEPGARELYPDWAEVAAETVASLRGSAAEHLNDPRLAQLVGELSLRSADFCALWARHDVRAKSSGAKRVYSPEVGVMTIHWEALQVASAPGQILVTYSAEAGSTSRDRLERLVSAASSVRGVAFRPS